MNATAVKYATEASLPAGDTRWDAFGTSSRRATGLSARRTWAFVLGVAAVLLLVGGAMSMLFTRTDPPKHKAVVQIAIITPQTPPPPKPKEEPPPPPKDEIKIDQPRPQPDEPQATPQAPPPGPLGLDAQGSGAGDSFGLAGRPGGREITASRGGGGLDFSLLGKNAARQIAMELARDPRLKSSPYRVEIRIWLSKDGRIEREEIVQGTGDRELDALIKEGLRQISVLHLTVPENLPQPLRIRVTSTDA